MAGRRNSSLVYGKIATCYIGQVLHLALALALAADPPLGLDARMPVPEDNPLTPEKVALGRRLFFDRRLSRDETVSCSSCHDPERAFSDGRVVAEGIQGRKGTRNAPALINRGYGRSFFWDGRAPTLEKQVLEPIFNPKEMDLPLTEMEQRIGLTAAEVSRALASYLRTILSGDSPFDRYMKGDLSALSEQQQRGLQIFRGDGNCYACHAGPNLADERFHNTGVAWVGGRLVDEGRGRGAFKTPTLREIARTGPYMHDGSLATLEDVIDYYDRGGNINPHLDEDIRPLRLSPEDKRALVAFLRSLSGQLSWGGR